MLRFSKALWRLTAIASFMLLALAIPQPIYAQQSINVGAADIGGVVTSSKGAEAGV